MLTRALVGARTFDRADRREADRLAQQRVPRDVEVAALGEPRLVDLLGAELDGDAAIRAHRALAGRVDERDDDAVPARLDRPEQPDAEVAQPGGRDRSCVIGASLADEVRAAAEGGDPRRHVRRLATGAQHDPRRRVGTRRERLLEPDDHIEDEVAEAEDRHRLRSFHGTRSAAAGEDRR